MSPMGQAARQHGQFGDERAVAPAAPGPRGRISAQAPAGRGIPQPSRGAAGSGASRADASWLAEDGSDWIARGVTNHTIPYVQEVLNVAHTRHWPATVHRLEGWTVVVFPVFQDMADAVERARAAEAPALGPEWARGAAGDPGRDEMPGGLVAEMRLLLRAPSEDSMNSMEPDANGVTWLGPPTTGSSPDAGAGPRRESSRSPRLTN